MNTNENLLNVEGNARSVGIIANIMFLVFLLFPFISLSGVNMHSRYRYIIWIMAITAMVLRIRKKEKAAMFFSILSMFAWIIIYAMLWQSSRLTEYTFGFVMKTHLFTVLLLFVSSILMIRPSLISTLLKK